ncbi:hypothetical protein RRG08_053787 [Elysia crispata]|uniref:Uncharacterized protein n=1 Tax=Elysia crispata TaxID=231223 RepID=A0AAE0ZBF0_9GAST|nr:hypothetical protein RRG08_053787 [Elysia crispata]
MGNWISVTQTPEDADSSLPSQFSKTVEETTGAGFEKTSMDELELTNFRFEILNRFRSQLSLMKFHAGQQRILARGSLAPGREGGGGWVGGDSSAQ